MRNFVMVLVLLSFSGLAIADQPAKTSLSALRTWFEHLKAGLAESAVSGQYQKRNVVAVAAVRGSAQESAEANKPSWKTASKEKKARARKQEKTELASAVDLILNGNYKDGASKLDAFEKAHPKSSLLPELHEAKQKLKELEASSPAPANSNP